MSDHIISLEGIGKSFGTEEGIVHALNDVSFEVHQGEFLCLIGPSGCGKSTLLRIISGLIKPDRGDVLLNGQPVKSPSPKLSMVFQDFALFPWLTVRENVCFGLKMQGCSAFHQQTIAKEYIRLVELEGFEHKHPKELSGGMKQRVGLARALAVNPDVLLMDEPFSSLDAFTAEELRQDVLSIWQKTHKTIIMVTHLTDEAVAMADKIIVMTKRPGTVKAILHNELARPRNSRSKDFYAMSDRLLELVQQ